MTCSSGGSTTEMSAIAWPSSSSSSTARIGRRRVSTTSPYDRVGVADHLDAVHDAGRRGGSLEAHLEQLGLQQRAAHALHLVVVDDRAVVDHDDPVGHVLDVGHVVRGQEDRRPPLLVQAHDHLPEPLLGEQVEPDRGLVEEQHLRPVQHASRRARSASAGRARASAPARSSRSAASSSSASSSVRRRASARVEPVDAARAGERLARSSARTRAASAGRRACRCGGRGRAAASTARGRARSPGRSWGAGCRSAS